MLSQLRSKGFSDYQSLREKEFCDLKVRLAEGEISNEEYYKKLAELRDIYFTEGTNEWTRYTLQIASYNKSVLEEQQKQINEFVKDISSDLGQVSSAYSESIDKMLKKQNDVKSRLEGISEIYNVVEVGSEKTGAYKWIQLSDINSELELLKSYNENLINARDRINEIFEGFGYDKEKTSKLKSGFLEELVGMNVPQATQFSKYLTTISEQKLSDYLSKWAEKTELESIIPANLFGEETAEMAQKYSEQMSQTFTQALTEKFGEIPDSFFESGNLSAEQFKEGFINAIDEVMNEITSELNRRISSISTQLDFSGAGTSVTNNSSYNIYGLAEPEKTALELYKEETKRRMLIGE